MESKYIEKNLCKDEHVVLTAKKSYWFILSTFIWLVILGGLYYGIYTILSLATGEELLALATQYLWATIIILVILAIPVLVVLIRFIARLSANIISQLAVTNKRVIAKIGILKTNLAHRSFSLSAVIFSP